MPTQHTASSQKSRSRAQPKGGARARAAGPSSATDERDETYALISVIYHALQGAETLGKYIEDAREADNDELVMFFEECQGRQNEIAMKGKRLLGEQLYETMDEDDDDED